MTVTIVDKSVCSKCGNEPRTGRSSWGRTCVNAANKDARERKRQGLPARPRGRPRKSRPEPTSPRTEPILSEVAAEIMRHQVMSEAEASVNDPDAPAPERAERTPGHGQFCQGWCCRMAPQA